MAVPYLRRNSKKSPSVGSWQHLSLTLCSFAVILGCIPDVDVELWMHDMTELRTGHISMAISPRIFDIDGISRADFKWENVWNMTPDHNWPVTEGRCINRTIVD